MGYRKVVKMIKTKKVVYQDVRCDSCGRELQSVNDLQEDDTWEYLQAEDALHVTLSGGYGEYIDSYTGGHEYIICKDCADTLLATFPFLQGAKYADGNYEIMRSTEWPKR